MALLPVCLVCLAGDACEWSGSPSPVFSCAIPLVPPPNSRFLLSLAHLLLSPHSPAVLLLGPGGPSPRGSAAAAPAPAARAGESQLPLTGAPHRSCILLFTHAVRDSHYLHRQSALNLARSCLHVCCCSCSVKCQILCEGEKPCSFCTLSHGAQNG